MALAGAEECKLAFDVGRECHCCSLVLLSLSVPAEPALRHAPPVQGGSPVGVDLEDGSVLLERLCRFAEFSER